MVHAAVSAGRTAGGAVPGRLRQRRLDMTTTPGRLRLLLGVLVLLSLAWGGLAAFTASHYAGATASVVDLREPLSLDAQQIYARLSDANDAAATAFLTGGLEPAATRQRYLADIAAASSGIENATAQGGARTGAAAQDLSMLARDLPVYAGEIETARADNRSGLPLGAAYLREASALMRGTPQVRGLLGYAQDLYATENASLSGTSAQATGGPLIGVTVAVGLAVGLALYLAARWLRGRTNRVFNVGLLAAGAVVVLSIGWLALVFAGARSDLLNAQARGLATVQAVAQVSIAAQEAHADESLTLIDNNGDDTYQADYLSKEKALGPGPGTLLGVAVAAAQGTPAASAVSAATADAQGWFGAHSGIRSLDDNNKHTAAVASVLGAAPGDAGEFFTRLTADLTTAIDSDQAVFDSTAHSAAGSYTGLAPGIAVAALLMAAAIAWGLGRRLAEYH
jgi:hypothetical protein